MAHPQIMIIKQTYAVLGAAFLNAAIAAVAATPAAERLLPQDTLAVLTCPDYGSFAAAYGNAPLRQLWSEPAFRPFKDKLVGKLKEDLIEPLERELGIDLKDYAGLLQGQFTLAVVRNGWEGSSDPLPALVLVLDTKDKAEQLQANLVQIRRKLSEAGKQPRTTTIRGVEFTTLAIDLAQVLEEVADGGGSPVDNPPKIELSFGKSGSLLVGGTSVPVIEQLLARQDGGGSSSLAELAAFGGAHVPMFRDKQAFGWVHFTPVYEVLNKLAVEAAARSQSSNPFAPTPDRLLSASGLGGLKTLGLGTAQTPQGGLVDLFMGVPEGGRSGLFSLIATQPNAAEPLEFVPADVIQFSRWRLDLKRFWASLETMLNVVSPGAFGGFVGAIEQAAKQRDPGFSFQRNIVNNLGDDIVSYGKPPRGTSLAELNEQPNLTLLRSPDAARFLQSIRTLLSAASALSPMFSLEVNDREFLGRTIYSVKLPALTSLENGEPVEQALQLTAANGYVAFTTDTALLEEFIRGAASTTQRLAATPGLAAAAEPAGGMATGLFAYQNDAENVRIMVEMLKENAGVIDALASASPINLEVGGAEGGGALKDWVDLSLLPGFDQISKYFDYSVYAGKMDRDGFRLKFYTPTPPGLR